MPRKNQSPYIDQRKGIKWWYYSFNYADKRYRGWLGAESKMTRRQAVAEYDKVKAYKIYNFDHPVEAVIPQKTPTTIFQEYLTHLEVNNPKTYKNYKYMLPKLKKFFGLKTNISSSDILAFRKWMKGQTSRYGKPYSEATINRHLDFCRNAFTITREPHNPFKRYNRPKEEERTRYLSKDELKLLLEKVSESDNRQLGTMVLTAIFTGLRKNAILTLHKSGIDFDHMLIRSMGKGGKITTTTLPDLLELQFKRYLEKHESGFVFENPFTKGRFTHIDRQWRTARDAAGIRDFRFHDLRHTFATYTLLETGNLKLVQELLGHSSVNMTQRYAHILAGQKSDAINHMAGLIYGNNDILNQDEN